MKIILAFDSFKGCMTAQEACHAAALGIRQRMPEAEVVACPLSDGGEGLVDCLAQRLPLERIRFSAHNPLMDPIEASYLFSPADGRAYMEMAATSGLPLVPPARRNPMLTSTYGVGEMILDALQRGCREVVMGIGGSATCDGGMGMLRCLQEHGLLHASGRILDPRLEACRFTVACDVDNPLYGPRGAAYVFAPQKGATEAQVVELDQRLRAFARESESLGIATPDLADCPGAGAAGGLGYGLMAYLHAELRSGIDILLDICQFDQLLEHASLVVTGEGRSDRQTLMGKVPHGVWRRASRKQVPVWLLSGGIDDAEGTLAQHFCRVQSINADDHRPLAILLQPAVAQANLQRTVVDLFQWESLSDGIL